MSFTVTDAFCVLTANTIIVALPLHLSCMAIVLDKEVILSGVTILPGLLVRAQDRAPVWPKDGGKASIRPSW